MRLPNFGESMTKGPFSHSCDLATTIQTHSHSRSLPSETKQQNQPTLTYSPQQKLFRRGQKEGNKYR